MFLLLVLVLVLHPFGHRLSFASAGFSVFSHPPTPGLCRLDRGSCRALRCAFRPSRHSPRGGPSRSGRGEQEARPVGRLWVRRPRLGAGPRQTTDRVSRYRCILDERSYTRRDKQWLKMLHTHTLVCALCSRQVNCS